MNKWYMHDPESVQVNETQKLFQDFEIQTDHLISARRPDLAISFVIGALSTVTKGLVQ